MIFGKNFLNAFVAFFALVAIAVLAFKLCLFVFYNNEEAQQIKVLAILLSVLIFFVAIYLLIFYIVNKDKMVLLKMGLKGIGVGNLDHPVFKEIFEAGTIVTCIDKNGIIIDTNYQNCLVSGYSKEELIGKHFAHYNRVDKNYEKRDTNRIWKMIKKDGSYKGIVKKVKKNGDYYYLQSVVAPVKRKDGKILKYIAISLDITHIVLSAKKAEAEKKARNVFMVHTGREIRTELRSIIDSAKNNKEETSVAIQNMELLLDKVNNMLSLVKIEDGKFNIFKKTTIFEAFMEDVVKFFSLVAKEKNIAFVANIDKNIPKALFFDPSRLQQVLTNLLNSVFKDSKKDDKVVLNIMLKKTHGKNAILDFSVENTKLVMSTYHQKQIFKPFNSNYKINKEIGNIGDLGLVVCSEAISLMGSRFLISSQENTGTKFCFTLHFNIENAEAKYATQEKICFLLHSHTNMPENNKIMLLKHLRNIGIVEDYDKEKSQKANMLFCFRSDDLEDIVSQFKKNNPDSFVVYIKEDDELDFSLYSLFAGILETPLYGSKIYNFVSEKMNFKSILKTEQKQIDNQAKLGGNILVAEDNANNQKLIEILLKKLNVATVDIVENGQEAIEAYKNSKEPYNVILMDINMPVMDGIEAAKEIIRLQKKENYYHVPIVAFTANSTESDKEEYIKIGMSDYLAKPVDFGKLTKIISTYMDVKAPDSKKDLVKKDQKENNKKEIDIDKVIENITKHLDIPKEIASGLYNSFCSTVKKRLEQLHKSLKQNNVEEVVDLINDFKNDCITLNLQEISQILEQLNKAKKNTNDDDIFVIFDELQKNLERYIIE